MLAYKAVLTSVICVMCIFAKQNCPDPNILESDKKEDLKYLKLETGTSHLKQLLKHEDNPNSEGVFFRSLKIVNISVDFQEGILLSLISAGVQVKVVSEVSLKLKAVRKILLQDVQNVRQSPKWQTVAFDIPKPVPHVKRLEMGFFSSNGFFKIKDIVFAVCVETAWCKWKRWSPCSKTCNSGKQSRNRVCKCPNSDPDRFVCSPGVDSNTRVCNKQCCPKPPLWNAWSEWSVCPGVCFYPFETSGRLQERTRVCIQSECPNGTVCPGTDKETRFCGFSCCPSCGPKELGRCHSCQYCKRTFRCRKASAECEGEDCCCFGRKLSKVERRKCQ